jgi:HAD superfamily hydrolase (TIGR01459 family)
MVFSLPIFPSLEASLAERTATTLFLDAYGVFWVGNAQGAFPGAVQTMERLFASGKKIGILSNSTQLAQSEMTKYEKKGFVQGRHFHILVTSGELARAQFSSGTLPFPTPRKTYCLFCPASSRYGSHLRLFETSPFRETDNLNEADFIYINVPHINDEDSESIEPFRPMVERFVASQKPMVCANPDRYAHEGLPARPVVRQGAIALLYEQMGGKVLYIGKPYPHIYATALALLNLRSPTQKSEIMMVGDTPETDIRGARSFGIHSALVTQTGIMAEAIAHRGLNDALQALPPTDVPDLLIERFAP